MRYANSHPTWFLCLALLVLAALPTNAASPAEPTCGLAIPAPTNGSLRLGGLDADGFEIFAFEVASPGLLAFDVASPGASAGEPVLQLRAGSCWLPGETQRRIQPLETLPQGQLVELRSPGSYLLRLSVAQPGERLERYRLNVRFVSWPVAAAASRVLAVPEPCAPVIVPATTEEEEEEEEEVDVDEAVNEILSRPCFIRSAPKPEVAEMTAFRFNAPGLAVVEAGGAEGLFYGQGDFDGSDRWVRARRVAGGGLRTVTFPGVYFFEPTGGGGAADLKVEGVSWCVPSPGDGHADSPFCATAVELGEPVAGELRNPWHDDVDHFTFTVDETAVVRIESTGPSDTLGALYDRSGNRLAVADDGGEGGNFRIVERLGPGRYFVRVEGSGGSEGPYGLRLRRQRAGAGRSGLD